MPHMLRAIRRSAKKGDDQFVTTHWLEVLDSGYEVDVEPALGARIVEILRNGSHLEAATATLDLAARRVDDSTPAGVLLRLARLAIELGSRQTAALVAVALANPDLPPEAREELEPFASLEVSGDTGEEAPAGEETSSTEDEADDKPVVHSVHAKRVVPRRLEGSTLEVEIDGRRHSVDLATIQVIAVCGISRAAQKPIVLVDLLLDPPWGDRPEIRAIRMTSDTYDPRLLVGGDDGMAAFQTLLDRLFEITEAVPLPDPDAARGKSFQSFSTIDVYEREVLGITS
jgi:hypothetical protein